MRHLFLVSDFQFSQTEFVFVGDLEQETRN